MSEEICQKFGTKLQELREAKGFSKGKLSVEADCDKSYIGKIERGEKTPGLKTIAKLSRALGIHVKELFDFEYDINKED
ncbi:MAG: helix-turn-helix transcriptional regulator [Candidatus Gastranaerophilales bacterium]|nr:helix-turn-helix transcriptional regulator [Candidatus Gastranaerophilales bacterium]